MTEAHNATVVRRVVEAMWNQGDLDVADVLFTANYINHAGLIPDLVRGPEAMKVSVALPLFRQSLRSPSHRRPASRPASHRHPQRWPRGCR